MRLTRFTDLALRALMLLSVPPRRVISSTELAERLNASQDHVVKGLQALAAQGLVTALRGRGGGFRLTRSAGRARIGALIRSLEPSLAMAECFGPDSTCPLTGDCRLAGVLAEARAAFFDTLDRYTVEELTTPAGASLVELKVGHAPR